MKKYSRYLLRVGLESRGYHRSKRCGCCDFNKLCSGFRWFNPYTCGFSAEMSEKIIRSNMYFKISRIYEDTVSVYSKDKIK
jgi:hypothetical protein